MPTGVDTTRISTQLSDRRGWRAARDVACRKRDNRRANSPKLARSRERATAWRALLGFQQLDAGSGEGQDGFEYDWCMCGVVREVQREGGVFFLDAVLEDANGNF